MSAVVLKPVFGVTVPKRTGMIDAIEAFAIAILCVRKKRLLNLDIGTRLLESRQRTSQVIFDKIAASPFAFQPFSNFTGNATPREGVNNEVARFGKHANEVFWNHGRKPGGVREQSLLYLITAPKRRDEVGTRSGAWVSRTGSGVVEGVRGCSRKKSGGCGSVVLHGGKGSGAGERRAIENHVRGSYPRWARVTRSEVSTACEPAPIHVRFPPHTLRLTTAGRMACSAR